MGVIGGDRGTSTLTLNGATTLRTLKLTCDGVGNVTSHLYRNAADDATIVGFLHEYDKVGNPEYEVRVHQSSKGDEYTYDALHRLRRTIYDDATPASPTASPSATVTDDFLYDLIGNRTKAYLKSADAGGGGLRL